MNVSILMDQILNRVATDRRSKIPCYAAIGLHAMPLPSQARPDMRPTPPCHRGHGADGLPILVQGGNPNPAMDHSTVARLSCRSDDPIPIRIVPYAGHENTRSRFSHPASVFGNLPLAFTPMHCETPPRRRLEINPHPPGCGATLDYFLRPLTCPNGMCAFVLIGLQRGLRSLLPTGAVTCPEFLASC